MPLETRNVPIDDFDPDRGVNYARPEKIVKIAESMQQRGWSERPLLAEECVPGLTPLLLAPHSPRGYVLWTGSHRIAAAHAAGLTAVPCRIIPYELVHATFKRLRSVVGFANLRTALTSAENGGGPRDHHRLAALEALGLTDAADALREEIEADEW